MAEGKGDHGDSKYSEPAPPRIAIAERVERDGERTEAQRAIRVAFILPSGERASSEFQAGQTVEVMKSYVETTFEIPMAAQSMFVGDRMLIDPLSLIDYAEFRAGGEVVVTVRSREGK